MESPLCLVKSMTRFCWELGHFLVIETIGTVGLDTDKLFVLFFFLCLVAGLVLVFLVVSTKPMDAATLGIHGEKGASEETDMSRSRDCLTTAPSAWKSVIAVSCGLLLGMLGLHGFVPLHFHMACGLLIVFLLASAERHFAEGILKSSAIHHGLLLLTLSCCGLIHLLVPESDGAVESGPAGFELALFLLFLCLIGGLALVSFQLRGRRVCERSAMLGSEQGSKASAPPQRSIQPALMLVALSCAGLVHLLVPDSKCSGQ